MATWPFSGKRQQKSMDVPEEVQEYYKSERRERIGIAWLLALATLVTTVVLAVGLYVGGRWAWHSLFGRDVQQPITTQEDSGQSSSKVDQEQSSIDQPTTTPQLAESTPQSTPSAPQPNPQPATESQNLTSTGPGDTLAVFVGASILGTLAYQVYIRRKLIRS